jgi:hypothetical protein
MMLSIVNVTKNVVLVNIKITTLMMFYLIINSVISICMYSLSVYFCLSINIAFLAEAVFNTVKFQWLASFSIAIQLGLTIFGPHIVDGGYMCTCHLNLISVSWYFDSVIFYIRRAQKGHVSVSTLVILIPQKGVTKGQFLTKCKILICSYVLTRQSMM